MNKTTQQYSLTWYQSHLLTLDNFTIFFSYLVFLASTLRSWLKLRVRQLSQQTN